MTKEQKAVYWWLWLGVAMILCILVIGGITRLTGSGLSITEWNVFMGTIPPLNEADWQTEFLKYQQIPQYQKLNARMTMDEFKFIYFWEYIHRLIARSLGIVFLIPFVYFWLKQYLSPTLKKQLLFLVFLGALQGGLGWFMVKSGLSELVYVSHYRLAAHLSMALVLMSACVWIAYSIKHQHYKALNAQEKHFKTGFIVIGVLIVFQIVWGAFTAGLKAGYQYNTFPLMYGSLIPMNMFSIEPALLNFTQNPGTVQWVHRVLGISVLIGTYIMLWIAIRVEALAELKKPAIYFSLLISVQVLLGILTLLHFTPLILASLHQLVAAFVIIYWLRIKFQLSGRN